MLLTRTARCPLLSLNLQFEIIPVHSRNCGLSRCDEQAGQELSAVAVLEMECGDC